MIPDANLLLRLRRVRQYFLENNDAAYTSGVTHARVESDIWALLDNLGWKYPAEPPTTATDDWLKHIGFQQPSRLRRLQAPGNGMISWLPPTGYVSCALIEIGKGVRAVQMIRDPSCAEVLRLCFLFDCEPPCAVGTVHTQSMAELLGAIAPLDEFSACLDELQAWVATDITMARIYRRLRNVHAALANRSNG